jgi:putative transposase
MPRYRRVKIEGGLFFFTLTLADRSGDLLVREIERIRRAYKATQQRLPFETIAICILPDHLHAVWLLPDGDSDYSARWSLFKSDFSRGVPAARSRSASKQGKREKGIWQRRYWEHAIRDDSDLDRHVNYIHYEAWTRVTGCGLAAFQLPPLRRARFFARRLGRPHDGHSRAFR